MKADGDVTRAVADAALEMLDVDALGLDVMDRKLLLAVIEKFGGGPVGVDNLAAAIGEERDTIEDVLEPYPDPAGLSAAHAARARRDARRVSALRPRRAARRGDRAISSGPMKRRLERSACSFPVARLLRGHRRRRRRLSTRNTSVHGARAHRVARTRWAST